MNELVRFTGSGHPALRASHGKTLEFTAESSVTARATCVLAVSATLPVAPVAGPIRITMTVTSAADSGCGQPASGSDRYGQTESETISLDAMGNSAWRPGESAVVRRSPARLPDTFATDASLAAADLPRSFAAALSDPAARLEVVVQRRASECHLVRFRLHASSDSRLRAEAVAADAVLAEDAGARARLRELGIAVGAAAVRSGRVLSVSSGPGGPSIAGTTGRAAEVIGWPAELAVLAAVADPAPAILALAAGPAEIALLAAANPGAAVVFRAEVSQAGKLLAQAGRPEASLVVAAVTDPERPRFGTAAAPDLPDRGELIGYLGVRPGPAPATPVEPADFVRGLLANGVTPRTVALALAGLPGWSRRAAYDFVLGIQNSG